MKPYLDRDGYWLAGLTDGEGCFSLYTIRRRNTRHPNKAFRRVGISFKIAMRSDDLHALEEAHRILGVGRISKSDIPRHQTYVAKNGKAFKGHPLRAFVVEAKNEIAIVVSFFRQYPLRSKKAKDFVLWAEAFEKFQAAISTTPLTWVRTNGNPRPVMKERRPLKGSPRLRFWSIPNSVYQEMERYSKEMRSARRFQ